MAECVSDWSIELSLQAVEVAARLFYRNAD